MKWKVITSCICLNTKTTFSLMKTDKNIRLILWCNNDFKLRRGDVLRCGLSSMYINASKVNMHILKVMPYNRNLWKTLLKSTQITQNKISFYECPTF